MRKFLIIYLFPIMIFLISCKADRPEIFLGEERYADGASYAWKYGIPPETCGYMLYDLEKREVVLSYNRDRAFIPASTTKLPTAVAALDILGPDYRFKTVLGYSGKIEKGVLYGDLFLKGGGDPLLSVTDLLIIATKLKEKGVKRIQGHFYYDEADLTSVEIIDKDMEIDQSYNPGISALSLDYNSIYAFWSRDWRSGKRPREMKVYLTPSLYINKTGISSRELKENITFDYKKTGEVEKWLLSPEEERSGRERLPVKNVGLYTAVTFAEICKIIGIKTGKPKKGIMPDSCSSIYEHEGEPLHSIVDVTLTYSNNMMAELLLLKTAKKIKKRSLDLEKSATILKDYYASRLKYIDWSSFYIKNGSGLTSKNRMTPEQLLSVLLYADSLDFDGRRIITFLPSSGWEWSLINRLNKPGVAFHVWAKTGLINYAIAMTGYLFTHSGKKMAFSFFISDFKKRQLYESDPDRRDKKSTKRVNIWLNSNKNAMDAVITDWIKNL